MEDPNAWECGRPDLNSRNTGNSDEAYFMDGDLPLSGNFSSFEAGTFGIQSAFNIDSDSDEVRLPPPPPSPPSFPQCSFACPARFFFLERPLAWASKEPSIK
jgi:hypothetical protein